MKTFLFEPGLVLAVISKDKGGSHGCLTFRSPVDWSEVSKGFDRALDGRTTEQVLLKAVVSSDMTTGFRNWLFSRKLIVSGQRTIVPGHCPRLKFDQVSGRLAVEESASKSDVAQPSSVIARREPVVTVLIVDDSKAMRMILRKILESNPKIKVIGEAALPSEALKILENSKPDVVTLDIQMPEMSGVELFKVMNKLYQIPAVMVSALGKNEGREVMDALAAGAFDYFQKPDSDAIQAQAPILQEKILQAAQSGSRAIARVARAVPLKTVGNGQLANIDLLAIGSSTGGTEAVRLLLEALPADIPPIVVVQHIPPIFSAAFAERLNSLCKFEVREATDGDEVCRGLALIAPGGLHLEVVKSGRNHFAKITDSPPVNRFRPSVDVLFRSVVREFKKDASRVTGIILTGMGNDGAHGLLELRKAGARTIGQDEQSSVVYGMPRAAAELGACEEVAALEDMATLLTRKRG